jgi:ABC-type glycerol-3-phosphate transport system permease component
MKKFINRTSVFDISNATFLLILCFAALYPFWYELVISFSSSNGAMQGGLIVWPRQFSLSSYRTVLDSWFIWKAFANSVWVVVAGTVLSVLVTAALAYAMSKPWVPGNRILRAIVLFSLLFNGGIIPTYLVIKSLGLIDTLWSLILPVLAAPFNAIVMMNFFRQIPKELEESAHMDGASPIRIFAYLVLPLSMPVIATVALWMSVGLWNDFMHAIIYINSREHFTLPVILREIIVGQGQLITDGRELETSSTTVIAATVVVSVTPILCVYPYLQKFFVKGVMAGSIKA